MNRIVYMAAALGLACLYPTRTAAEERHECAQPRVDVAGHLTIAANTDPHALRERWRWGAVPVGIAIRKDGAVYWAEYRSGAIKRANADGQHVETVATVDGPLGIALDDTRDELFYVTDRHYPRTVGRLRADGPTSLVCGADLNRPFAIAVGKHAARIYWTESINGRIRSARSDGTDLTTLFDDGIATVNERAGAVALSSFGIAVEERTGFVFWSDVRTATISRARFDGSEQRVILGREQGLDFPTALAVDGAGETLYWADPGSETIGRASLDGSHPEVIAGAGQGVLEPYGIAFDGARLYWTDVARNAIYRIDLDSKQVERFIDLAGSGATARDAVVDCGAAAAQAQREFLPRWVKLVRTCVLAVTATAAVLRSPADLALPAKTCTRQLRNANDVAPLRATLAPHCEAQLAAGIESALQLGAEVVAADLPRARSYLRKIRSFVAREPSSAEALAALHAIVQRLAAVQGGWRAKPAEVAPLADVAWTRPASGQTTSYRSVTRGATGDGVVADDGATTTGAPLRYVDNGDGTISDPSSGLVWEKKCSGCGGLHDAATRVSWRSRSGEMDVVGWLAALNSEHGTGFAGHGDWRLPDVAELVSIHDYELFNPALSEAFDGGECAPTCGSQLAAGCSCTALGPYWSAAARNEVVPVVLSNLGLVLGRSSAENAFVRAVRGTHADRGRRFVDNGDGTITDLQTKLMWEKKVGRPGDLHDVERRTYWSFDGTEETLWDWLRALNDEGARGFAGYRDWRIPNVKELYSLVDATRDEPTFDSIFTAERCADAHEERCGAIENGSYWTSTTFADFPALALTVAFGAPAELEHEPPPGVIRVAGGIEPHEKTLRRAVRAVRGPILRPSSSREASR